MWPVAFDPSVAYTDNRKRSHTNLMSRSSRNIMRVFLIALYLATSSGMAISKIEMPPLTTASDSLRSATEDDGCEAKPASMARRHLPMVKEVNLSPFLSVKLPQRHEHEHWGPVPSSEPQFTVTASYFSSLSDKAPPRF